jgi:hypothetical protein
MGTTNIHTNFNEWLANGINEGWCGPPICHTHDGLPTTPEEDQAWEDGDDPCTHILRLYENETQKNTIENNHSPSTWRKTGWTQQQDTQ